MNKPKVVCLCGSTRFADTFREVNERETLAGNIVLAPGCFSRSTPEEANAGIFKGCTEEQKKALDVLHMRKIDIADEVLVLHVNGYVGESTRAEIFYATAIQKPIRWLESPWNPPAGYEEEDSELDSITQEVEYLRQEVKDLRQWKKEAMSVESWWQEVSDYIREKREGVMSEQVSHIALRIVKQFFHYREAAQCAKRLLDDTRVSGFLTPRGSGYLTPLQDNFDRALQLADECVREDKVVLVKDEFKELLNAARILEVGDLDEITTQDTKFYDRHQVSRRIVKDLVKKHADLIED